MSRYVVRAVVIVLGLSSFVRGQTPNYPKIDVATSYQVDPSWPQKPDSLPPWGEFSGMAVDRDDNVWVFHRGEDPVQVYTADGAFVRTWGRGVLKTPHHLKIDHDGNIWVADTGRHQVLCFTPGGELLRTLGTEGEPGDDEAHFNKPTDMAISPTGEVFVSDGYGNNRVMHFDADGKFVKQWGTMGVEPGQLSQPHAIAMDSKGRLYVADRNNVRIQVFAQSGEVLDVWNNLVTPWGITITPRDEVWVCGASPMVWDRAGASNLSLGGPPKDQLFLKFDTAGKVQQLWCVPMGVEGQVQPGDLAWVHCLAIDSQGNLYAGDVKGKRAQKFVKVRGAAERHSSPR